MRMQESKQTSWLQRLLVGGNIKFTLARIICLVVFAFLLIKYVMIPVRCEGLSMEPNYPDHSIHLVYKLAYWNSKPQRGDVVAIAVRETQKLLLMKRIIGLPGEKISIQSGVVYVDGEPLDEPWVQKNRFPWNRKEVELRADEYLVIGDNRSMPMHQHELGEVNIKRIQGKIIK
jgi:signal peptidase I